MRTAFLGVKLGANQLGVEHHGLGKVLRQPSQLRICGLDAAGSQCRICFCDARTRLPFRRIAMQDRIGQRKGFARAIPVLQCRFRQPTPERGVAIVVEGLARNVVMRVVIAAHHVVGRRAHGLQLQVALKRRVVRLGEFDQPKRFRAEAVAEIEARERNPGAICIIRLHQRECPAQSALCVEKIAAAGPRPGRKIEEARAVICRCECGRRIRCRKRRSRQLKPVRTRNGHPRLRHAGVEIVRQRRDDETCGGR